MWRVVWLFPEPVRTAQTATTGFDEVSAVSCGGEPEGRPGGERGMRGASRARG